MTTAHRPTFDPARGKDAQRGPAYHQRLLPAHKTLKYRQATQGTAGENASRDLRSELLRAERKHQAKKDGREPTPSDDEEERTPLAIEDGTTDTASRGVKRALSSEAKTSNDAGDQPTEEEEEDYESKRRRVLEETRAIDADSSASDSSSSSSSEDEDSDDESALIRELAKIKAERAEAARKEAAEKATREEEEREKNIARGNPLLNEKTDYGVKRRWDDDVVFKNQARGTSEREKGRGKEFVNDLLRSDFHKRFMNKYVR